MTDRVSSAERSRIMAAVRGKNTLPEMTFRKFLHAHGFRYRLHRKDLPGTPDLVLPKYKLAVFVHGCFWHSHQGCFYATKPSSNTAFWSEKMQKNAERDERQYKELLDLGWRVLVIWECGLRLNPDGLEDVISFITGTDYLMVWPSCPVRVSLGE